MKKVILFIVIIFICLIPSYNVSAKATKAYYAVLIQDKAGNWIAYDGLIEMKGGKTPAVNIKKIAKALGFSYEKINDKSFTIKKDDTSFNTYKIGTSDYKYKKESKSSAFVTTDSYCGADTLKTLCNYKYFKSKVDKYNHYSGFVVYSLKGKVEKLPDISLIKDSEGSHIVYSPLKEITLADVVMAEVGSSIYEWTIPASFKPFNFIGSIEHSSSNQKVLKSYVDTFGVVGAGKAKITVKDLTTGVSKASNFVGFKVKELNQRLKGKLDYNSVDQVKLLKDGSYLTAFSESDNKKMTSYIEYYDKKENLKWVHSFDVTGEEVYFSSIHSLYQTSDGNIVFYANTDGNINNFNGEGKFGDHYIGKIDISNGKLIWDRTVYLGSVIPCSIYGETRSGDLILSSYLSAARLDKNGEIVWYYDDSNWNWIKDIIIDGDRVFICFYLYSDKSFIMNEIDSMGNLIPFTTLTDKKYYDGTVDVSGFVNLNGEYHLIYHLASSKHQIYLLKISREGTVLSSIPLKFNSIPNIDIRESYMVAGRNKDFYLYIEYSNRTTAIYHYDFEGSLISSKEMEWNYFALNQAKLYVMEDNTLMITENKDDIILYKDNHLSYIKICSPDSKYGLPYIDADYLNNKLLIQGTHHIEKGIRYHYLLDIPK